MQPARLAELDLHFDTLDRERIQLTAIPGGEDQWKEAMLKVFDLQQPPNNDFPDVYFTPAYGNAIKSDENKWVSIQAFQGCWQVPLLIRPIGNEAYDAVSPYGFSGIYCEGLTAAQQEEAWSLTVGALEERRVVSVFFRRSPMVPQADLHPRERLVVQDHVTTVLDLRNGREVLWSSMQGRSRTSIRKAIKAGLTVNVRPVTPSDVARGSPFRRLYHQTMERNAAQAEYHFSDAYYGRLSEYLSDDLMIVNVFDAVSQVGASALLMRHGQFLHYHLSGSDPDAARAGANNLLIWGAASWAVDEELSFFHLGGGIHNDDALWRFKSSFGGTPLHYCTSGLIINNGRYDELVRQHASSLGVLSADLQQSFFPLYRSKVKHE